MNFDHILFPTDFSERSRVLNKQVEWLASNFHSRVTLMHVFEIPAAWYGACEASFINVDCFDAVRDSVERQLNAYELNIPTDRLKRIAAQGDVAGEILQWADEHDVDLIAMGTHGYGALQGWLLGSVTAKVLHSARCPVWTDSSSHPLRDRVAVSKILCAVELVNEAVPLLKFTNQLAQDLGATVQLIHSIPEIETRPNRYLDFDFHRYLMESARVELAKIQREAGTSFPVTLSGIGVSHALEEAVHEHGADLVVIGRGRAQKTWGRFQTYAYEIIGHAPCPVLSCSLNSQDHIFSFCNAEHLDRSGADAPLLTGCPTF
jgi:nucleotide-binding universal stress UspA family protein